AGGLGARLAQHPPAEEADQPGLLGDRDERVGRQRAARVMPAQQRLGAPQPTVHKGHEWLVDERELAPLDGARKAADEVALVGVERAERGAQDALLIAEDLLLQGAG